MPHRLGRHEDLGAGLVRLARDDLAAARAALAAGPTDTTIHRVRQRLKRVRSVLRVLRPQIGGRAESVAALLREAAGLLAGARDRDAALASARNLCAAPPGAEAGFARVVESLGNEARSSASSAGPAVDRVDRLIAEAARQLSKPADAIEGERLLAQAFDRAYRRGRQARRRAETSLATPDLHAWRKSVKDLWHLMRLARKRLPRASRAVADNLERLGELLGLDHDHAILAEKLALAPAADPALMQQLSLIARRRRAIEAEAFSLGKRLYRRRPRDFRREARLA